MPLTVKEAGRSGRCVHHYADDHLNTYVRFKLALTDEAPLIKGYSEKFVGRTAHARWGRVEPPMQLLAALRRCSGRIRGILKSCRYQRETSSKEKWWK